MNKTYSFIKAYLPLGQILVFWSAAVSVFFVVMVFLSSNPQIQAIRFPLIVLGFGIFGGTIPLMYRSVRFYRKCTFVVTDDRIEWKGAYSSIIISWIELVEARWRKSPGIGGSLLLRSSKEKIVVDSMAFSKEDYHELVRFLRYRIPFSVQNGWERYWTNCWLYFDEPDMSNHEELVERARRSLVTLIFVAFMLVPCGLMIWHFQNYKPALFMPLVPLMFLPLLHRRFNPFIKRKVSGKYPLDSKYLTGIVIGWMLPLLLILSFIVCGLVIPDRLLELGRRYPDAGKSIHLLVGIIFGTLIFPIAIFGFLRGRHVRSWQAKIGKIAEEVYLKPSETQHHQELPVSDESCTANQRIGEEKNRKTRQE